MEIENYLEGLGVEELERVRDLIHEKLTKKCGLVEVLVVGDQSWNHAAFTMKQQQEAVDYLIKNKEAGLVLSVQRLKPATAYRLLCLRDRT
jgi:hypothetical protein